MAPFVLPSGNEAIDIKVCKHLYTPNVRTFRMHHKYKRRLVKCLLFSPLPHPMLQVYKLLLGEVCTEELTSVSKCNPILFPQFSSPTYVAIQLQVTCATQIMPTAKHCFSSPLLHHPPSLSLFCLPSNTVSVQQHFSTAPVTQSSCQHRYSSLQALSNIQVVNRFRLSMVQ